MKKYFSLIFVLFAFMGSLSAQDKIYFRDSTVVDVKIKQILENEVKYMFFSSSNGLIYSVPKNKIIKIVYANGSEDNFDDPSLSVGPHKIKNWPADKILRVDSNILKRKNILLYNPFEYFDGAYGFTYGRMINKYNLSVFAAYSYCPVNGKSTFSNGILTEKNENYRVNHKNTDMSLNLNYNFIFDQPSFPFLGLSTRLAQFEGEWERKQFTLNKYYIYVNSGFVGRTDNGLTLMINLALGRYFNDYTRSDPWPDMERHYRNSPKPFINSFQFSIQAGYSF